MKIGKEAMYYLVLQGLLMSIFEISLVPKGFKIGPICCIRIKKTQFLLLKIFRQAKITIQVRI